MLLTTGAQQRQETSASEFSPGEGLRFATGRERLLFLRSRSEEAPCREHQIPHTIESAAAVDSTVLELMYSWNHHDGKAWAACFTSDAEYETLAGNYCCGRAEIEAHQRELHATVWRHASMRISEWEICFIDPEWCTVSMNWEMKSGAQRKKRGVLVLLLTPEGERWRATAAYNSDLNSVPTRGMW